MDINNNQQTNTFSKGMNTDTSDMYIQNDQYRYAENLRFLTNEGENSGELRSIEDWLNRYTNPDAEIIATTAIRDYGIVILKRENKEKGVKEWYILKFDKNGSPLSTIFGPCEDMIGDHPTIVTRYESEKNVKLYIADGIHELMVINVYDTPAADNAPKEISSITNHFEKLFSPIETKVVRPGNIKAPVVQYAYLLYNKYGFRSSVTNITNTISLYKSEASYDLGMMLDDSGCSVDITINVENEKYDRISIYRIAYVLLGQQPTISLIEDVSINDRKEIKFRDSGTDIQQLSVAEFIQLDSNLRVIPGQIESKNNYLFLANVKDSQYSDEELNKAYDAIDAKAMSPEMEKNLDLSQDYDSSAWRPSGYLFPGYYLDGFVNWQLVSESSDINERKHDGNKYKSLKRDEIYRYGLLLYDKYGNKWPVKWIADIRTPRIIPFTVDDKGMHANNLVIKWKVNLGDYSKYFPAVQIVRCKRTINDSATICQGIVGATFLFSNENRLTNKLCPTGFLTLGQIHTDAYSQRDEIKDTVFDADTNHNVLLFFSPDVSYQHDDVMSIVDMSNEVYLREISTFDTLITDFDTKVEYDDEGYILVDNVDDETKLWYKNNNSEKVKLNGSNTTFDNLKVRYKDIKQIPGGLRFIYELEFGRNYRTVVDQLNFFKSHPKSEYHHNFVIDQNFVVASRSIWTYDKKTIVDEHGILPIHNIIRPSTKYEYGSEQFINCKIKNYSYCSSPEIDGFNDANGNFTYMNHRLAVGPYEFIKWSVPTMLLLKSELQEDIKDIYKDDNVRDILNTHEERTKNDVLQGLCRYPIGLTGSCLLLNLTDPLNPITNKPLPISIYDLRKNVTPYGGFNEAARKNSVYTAYSQPFKPSDEYVTIHDGDCYIQPYFCTALHNWNNAMYPYAPRMVTTYIVPIETTIDMLSDSGDSYRVNLNLNVQEHPCEYNGYVQEKDLYMYNTAYSSQPDVISYYSRDDDFKDVNEYDTRVIYSNPKTNGERIDNWTLFLAANFIDVDTRFGQITNLRLFKDALLFWQEGATGVLSVNERTILLDANDTNIILGNGDVLQRYDYLTTEYGMKPNQYADTQSNTTLYWWDGYKKEILGYSGGQSVLPMNKVKTVSNYINKIDDKDFKEYPKLEYDSKYNEVLISISKGESLVYSELMQQFLGVYTRSFNHSCKFNDKLYLADMSVVYEWGASNKYLSAKLKYIVNNNSQFVKTFDVTTFGIGDKYHKEGDNKLKDLVFTFDTKEQHSELKDFSVNEENEKTYSNIGRIENREYDYRFDIPRYGNSDWGNRMRGKTMQCELTVDNSTDFSILYITTKYRISWS